MILPSEFTTYTRSLFGDELYDKFVNALDEPSPVSIRLNQFKIQNIKFKIGASMLDEILSEITLCNHKPQSSILKPQSSILNPQSSNLKPQTCKVPWCPCGYYLTDRPSFTFDPLFHAGLYYVQEASSMFICEVARQLFHKPLMMLDLCAAPGGKTTALRPALPEGSLLFTNEPVKLRASILKENVEKWGHPDVIVTNNYPKDYQKAKLTFDAILADVPCSGEGMFRKDPNAIREWSPQNVEKCRLLQRSIIEDIWPCLRPGGILIYSTCTYNAHEDEENVQWIADSLGADFIKIETKDEWGIRSLPFGGRLHPIPCREGRSETLRFIPGLVRGEGLFMAVLRKRGEDGVEIDAPFGAKPFTALNGKKEKPLAASPSFRHWLTGDFSFSEDKGFIRAIPTRWLDIYNKVKGKLHVIHAGVGIGTAKGKDIIPDASLALSTSLDSDAFPTAELCYNDAIRFLGKEAIVVDPSLPKGFILVTYKNLPLGFVKNLGTRANNLYPKEWRIRASL